MKRVLSIIYGLTLMLTAAWAEPSGNWADLGNYANEFESIDWSSDPVEIHIRTAAQLAKCIWSYSTFSSNNVDVYLDEDIDLSAHYWTPPEVGSYKKNPIHFYGNGHTISGLYIKDYSTGGLFGRAVSLTIEDLTLSNAHIDVSDASYAGFLVADLSDGSINNCVVENSSLTVRYDNNVYNCYVGGLVGYYELSSSQSCSGNKVVGSTISLSCSKGAIGGLFGGIQIYHDNLTLTTTDCHATVQLSSPSATATVNMGGLLGESKSLEFRFLYCSSSGTLAAEGDANSCFGGLVGANNGRMDIYHCVAAMSVEGNSSGSFGGLVGHLGSNSNTDVNNSFSSSYLYSSAAGSNLGGLVGVLQTDVCNLTNSTFSGTICGAAGQGGSVVGYIDPSKVDGLKDDHRFNGVVYDRSLCSLPAVGNADGFEEDAEVLTGKKTKELASDNAPYNSLLMAPIDIKTKYENEYKKALCYEDNLMLAAMPFYVKDPQHAYYCAWHTTTTFQLIPLAYNRATKTALAMFDVAKAPGGADPNTFLNVEEDAESAEKTVTPTDPGEADIIVTYRNQATLNRVQRKVRLRVDYGVPWNDNEPIEFAGGNGAINDPFLIQNASQLIAVANNKEVYNRPDKYYRLSNDIFINTNLIQNDETVKAGANVWTPVEWHANLDGNGKTIYGLNVRAGQEAVIEKSGHGSGTEVITFKEEKTGAGLFSLLSGYVHDLAIVDSYLTINENYTQCGLLCGIMTGEAKIERCMVHGIVDSWSNCGGLVGQAVDIDFQESSRLSKTVTTNCGTVEDCFACVHVEYGLETYHETGKKKDVSNGSASGIAGVGVRQLNRCVSTGKVENFSTSRGVGVLVDASLSDINTWYFDKQQMTTEKQSTNDRGEHVTSEMNQGDLFANNSAWQHEKGRYPMLRQFADTPYGDLLSMPVLFADGDRAGRVTSVFEFPIENVTWSAVHGDTYVDVINECGGATPMSTGSDYIYAQTDNSVSKCTKALRVMQVDPYVPEGTIVGIDFKDDACEAAWLSAFGKSSDDVVTLRNVVTVTESQTKVFNTAAQELGVTAFPEMRFFTGIKVLKSGMLSNLSQLSELQLPRQLTDIGPEAFSSCASLEEVTIPTTTTAIEPGILDGSSVKDVFVESRNTSFEVRDHALYTTDDDLRLMAYPPARTEKSVTLHGPFHNIARHAFNRVPELDTIFIDYPKPEGSVIQLEDDEAILHYNCDNGQLMDIYVNDGTSDGEQWSADQYATGGNLDGILMREFLEKSYWEPYALAGKLHRYFPLTVTSVHWATLYIGFCTQLPDGVKAYVVPTSPNNVTDNTLTLQRVSNRLHHTVPVVIYSEQPATFILTPEPGMSELDDIPMWGNYLMGTDIGQNGSYGYAVNQSEILNEYSVLTLGIGHSSGTIGFYGYIGERIPPYKAYLLYNQVNAMPFSVAVNDEIVISTAINEHFNNVDKQSDGLLIYDLSGRRISINSRTASKEFPSNLKPGLYIVNGRKVVVR